MTNKERGELREKIRKVINGNIPGDNVESTDVEAAADAVCALVTTREAAHAEELRSLRDCIKTFNKACGRIVEVCEGGECAATTGDAPAETKADDGKNPAAVALGRLGGIKGGKARAAKMSKKARSEAATKAAKARWNKG